MTSVHQPVWVRRALGWILPGDYRDDVALSLRREAARRFGDGTSRLVLQAWYVSQVLSPSMILLAFRVRRLEGNRRGALATGPRGGWRGLVGEVVTAPRVLRRRPLFAVAVVFSLTLGIGANVAIFSAANAVLLKPPPYHDPDRLALVWNHLSGFDDSRLPMFAHQVWELRGDSAVFADVAAIWTTGRTVALGDRAVLAQTGLITPNFFTVLGVDAALGRTFAENEGLEGSTAIISDVLWKQEFGGTPDVLGRGVVIEGEEAVIVGVLPPDFRLLFPPDVGVPPDLDVFVPFPWVAVAQPGGQRFMRAVARLRDGTSIEAANEAVMQTSARLRATFAEIAQGGDEFRVIPLQADAVAAVRPVLMSLVGAVVLFLLLTSTNVAGLVLAHASGRRRDLVVRAWLGASRGRLAGQVMAEIGTLALLGAALGLLVGSLGASALWALRPPDMGGLPDITLDVRVMSFVAFAGIAAALGASVVPLLRLSVDGGGAAHLREPSETRTVGRIRRGIIVAEFALALVLVVGAGLMTQSVARLQEADLGFASERVLTFRLALSNRLFPEDRERADLARTLEEEIGRLPGVSSVGAGSHLPLGAWANWGAPAAPPEVPVEERDRYFADHRSASVGYFEALGSEIVQGRAFRVSDDAASEPVVVIDQTLAARLFGEASSVGETLVATRYVGRAFVPTEARIVGVVGSVRDRAPDLASQGQLFWPYAQSPRWELGFVVGTVEDHARMSDAIRDLVPGVHPDLAVTEFRSMDSYVRDATADARFVKALSMAFSFMALVLAAFGVYGVVASSIDARTRELGLRIAMGAEGKHLFTRVLGDGMRLGLAGVAIGLILVVALTRFLRGILYGVDPLDPVVLTVVAVSLLLVSTIATVVPAYRASRLDPVRSIVHGAR